MSITCAWLCLAESWALFSRLRITVLVNICNPYIAILVIRTVYKIRTRQISV